MPYTEVMHKWKTGKLHSGSKTGPTVTKQKQAVAIMLSEKRAAEGGKKEYQPVKKKYQSGGPVDDSPDFPDNPKSGDMYKDPKSGTNYQFLGDSSSKGGGFWNAPELGREEWETQSHPQGYETPIQKAPGYKPPAAKAKPIAKHNKGGEVTKDSGKGWRRW